VSVRYFLKGAAVVAVALVTSFGALGAEPGFKKLGAKARLGKLQP
jgi:hypothetical protein